MSQLTRFNGLNTARFITFSCYHHYNLFKTSSSKEIFIKSLDALRNKHKYKLYGYVIMPNHVHLVVRPPENYKMGIFIGALKSITAREILSLWKTNNIKIYDKLKVNKGGKTRFAFW